MNDQFKDSIRKYYENADIKLEFELHDVINRFNTHSYNKCGIKLCEFETNSSYIDSIENKPREYDVKCCIASTKCDDHRNNCLTIMCIECKNSELYFTATNTRNLDGHIIENGRKQPIKHKNLYDGIIAIDAKQFTEKTNEKGAIPHQANDPDRFYVKCTQAMAHVSSIINKLHNNGYRIFDEVFEVEFFKNRLTQSHATMYENGQLRVVLNVIPIIVIPNDKLHIVNYTNGPNSIEISSDEHVVYKMNINVLDRVNQMHVVNTHVFTISGFNNWLFSEKYLLSSYAIYKSLSQI